MNRYFDRYGKEVNVGDILLDRDYNFTVKVTRITDNELDYVATSGLGPVMTVYATPRGDELINFVRQNK